MSRTPPGPRSLLPGRLLRTLQRDPIPLFTRLARDYGDAAMFSVLGQKIVLFNHPDLVAELLVTQNRFFHKSRVLQRSKIVFGEGLLTSEDPLHLRQRRLAQPAFHRERIARYAEVMVACAARTRERWRDGETLDVHHEMMRLTLDVVATTLFGADVGGEADEIGAALTQLVDLFPLLMNPVAPLMMKLPIPSTRRFRRAVERLDRTIYAIVDERRRSGEDRGDLLSMLLLAQDDEGDGSGMTDRQLRDEAMTLFLAGHETTANALAWTFYLLGRHPDVADALHAHVDEVLGDRLPSAADYPRLHFVECVLAESMRLFPPAWAVSRLAMQDITIGDWLVPRGAVAVAAQAVLHRDARWWPEPERFDPSRFTAEAKAGRPKFAYFPFGGGPRICIGEGFAWMEGVLLLATLAQRWRFELLTAEVEAQASITLRPRGGIWGHIWKINLTRR
jgi:cytochrome P450